jgi:hypothetical protein
MIAALVLFGANVLASNIATIESQPPYPGSGVQTLDSNPIITAIASQPGTFGGHTYTGWAVLAQDSTGSIDLFGSAASFGTYVPAVGDAISAQGYYSPYHQIPELTSPTSLSLVSSGNPVPASPIATIGSLNSSMTIPLSLAGYPVEIDNVSIFTDSAATIAASGNFAAGNTAFYLKDSGGNIMEMYFWYTSYAADGMMTGMPIPTGPVNVVGLLSQSTTFPVEITPLSFTAVPEPSTVALVGIGLLGLLGLRRRHS